MFRPTPMIRMDVVVLEKDQWPVLRDLGRQGAIQLTRTRPGPDTAPMASRDCGADLARWDRIRTRVEELRQSLDVKAVSGELEPKVITLSEAEEGLRSIEKEAAGLWDERRQLAGRHKELAVKCEQAGRYRELKIPLDGDDRFQFLHFVTGSLPVENLEGLEKGVDRNVALLPAALEGERQSLVAVTTIQGRSALEEALGRAGFQRETLLKTQNATSDVVWEESGQEREQTARELEGVTSRLRAFADGSSRTLDELERLSDAECRLLEESRKFPRTEQTVLLSGWAPADNVPALKESLGKVTGGRCAVHTTLPDNSWKEEIPILLSHSRVLRPFEVLVSTYGSPGYWELEPTFFVALSYIFMFGMMFGDAGHGAVLAAGGLIALLAGRSVKMRDFGLLLLFGGCSSMVSGAVYGSYFGIGLFKKYALWHDPLEGDPMHLMYFAIGFGVVMMSLGLTLNVINRFQRGDVIGAFLDRFGLTGLLFYWGALALLILGPAIRSRGLMTLSLVLFLAVPIVCWAVKEPLEHFLKPAGERNEADGGMAGAAAESVVGAFEAVLSYLANTISFVRLAAYAMSHAALLVAAFVLARELRDVPWGGGLMSLVVIILGNVIAIVLEGIIASVQALRLEYYEFFGKFFSGSGQPFKPFRLTADD